MTRSFKLRSVKFCFILLAGVWLCGCSPVRMTGGVIRTAGKAGWGTARLTGKVLKTTGRAVVKTGKMTGDVARTVVYMARGKQVIHLDRQGNSLYAPVRLNGKKDAKFLVDTGASQVQISRAMARKLGLRLKKARMVPVSVAGGHMVPAREVILKEVKVGKVRVKNVPAIVLDSDRLDAREGLLGMSFLNHFLFQVDAQRRELILQQRK